MHYVYLIRSETFPKQTYIGFTADLKERIAAHNAGKSKHTAKYVPWRLISYHAFANEATARAFEQDLKTGSGQAFASNVSGPLARSCSPHQIRIRSLGAR